MRALGQQGIATFKKKKNVNNTKKQEKKKKKKKKSHKQCLNVR